MTFKSDGLKHVILQQLQQPNDSMAGSILLLCNGTYPRYKTGPCHNVHACDQNISPNKVMS